MGIDTAQYIRKPLYVDAVRISAANFQEVATWCQGEIEDEGGKQYIKVRVHNPKNIRQTKAFVGDWLLYTERGYKVYTNKAFHAAFDEVGTEQAAEMAQAVLRASTEAKISQMEMIPKFYIDEKSGELTEVKPHKHAQPLALAELMNIVRNELVGGEIASMPNGESPSPADSLVYGAQEISPGVTLNQAIQKIREAPTNGNDTESPEMKLARETIEAEGGTVEPATPDAIAAAVLQNEQTQPKA